MVSIGSIRTPISLVRPRVVRDVAGFTTRHDQVVASVRAFVEVRHASAAWVNRAAYTNANMRFLIRTIPGIQVTPDLEITTDSGRFVIDTVEQIGRYIEILAHQCVPEATQREKTERSEVSGEG